MDTSEEKPRKNHLWTSETAPRGSDRGSGRPKGSGLKTLRDAFTARMAEADSRKAALTAAEGLAETAFKMARAGDSKHLEIIRRITEGDRVALSGPNGEPIGPNVVIIHRVVKSEPETSESPSRVAPVVQPSPTTNGNGNGRH